jgi:hypothetical protein
MTLASSRDLRAQSFNPTQSTVTWVVAIVTDVIVNVDDTDLTSSAAVKGKLLSNIESKSTQSEVTFYPLNANTTNAPIIGETILAVRTGDSGYFYISSINTNGSINNNIDLSYDGTSRSASTQYVQKSIIKNQRDNTIKIEDQTSKSLNTVELQRSLRRIGDLKFEGRFGNHINLSFDQQNRQLTSIRNSDSVIVLSSDSNEGQRIEGITFDSLYGSEQSLQNVESNKIIIDSDKLIFRSRNGSTFFESSDNIALTSNKSVTIDSLENISINPVQSGVVRLGGNAQTASHPSVLGDELVTTLFYLFTAIKQLTSIVTDPKSTAPFDSPTVHFACKTIDSTLNNIIKTNDVFTELSNSILSKKVYIQ